VRAARDIPGTAQSILIVVEAQCGELGFNRDGLIVVEVAAGSSLRRYGAVCR